MINERWLIAAAAVGGGLLLGAVVGSFLRRWLARDTRRPVLREVAGPASVFVFWLATATGAIVAMAATSPDTLRPIPSDILAWMPNVLAAGLILLAGYALAVAVSGSLSRGFLRATGHSSRLAERSTRGAVITGSVIVALGQLGVETTILIVLTSGAAAAAALAAGLLAGLGGRDVASSIAAGRALRPELEKGRTILVGGEEMKVVHLRPATAVLENTTGDLVVVSYTNLLDRPMIIRTKDPEDPDPVDR